MSVWRRASGEPRVARRSVPTAVTIPWPRLKVEEDAQRLDEPLAAWRAGGLLQEHGGLVEHLGQRGRGGLVHLLPLLLAEVGQLRTVALELGHPQRLEARRAARR